VRCRPRWRCWSTSGSVSQRHQRVLHRPEYFERSIRLGPHCTGQRRRTQKGEVVCNCCRGQSLSLAKWIHVGAGRKGDTVRALREWGGQYLVSSAGWQTTQETHIV